MAFAGLAGGAAGGELTDARAAPLYRGAARDVEDSHPLRGSAGCMQGCRGAIAGASLIGPLLAPGVPRATAFRKWSTSNARCRPGAPIPSEPAMTSRPGAGGIAARALDHLLMRRLGGCCGRGGDGLHAGGDFARRRACSSTAAAIAVATSSTSPMAAPIIAHRGHRLAGRGPDRGDLAAISSVALAVCAASAFTSLATTAKPLPASPARAASMVAFSASRLVWPAMSLISRTTSPIRAAVLGQACWRP